MRFLPQSFCDHPPCQGHGQPNDCTATGAPDTETTGTQAKVGCRGADSTWIDEYLLWCQFGFYRPQRCSKCTFKTHCFWFWGIQPWGTGKGWARLEASQAPGSGHVGESKSSNMWPPASWNCLATFLWILSQNSNWKKADVPLSALVLITYWWSLK